MSRRATRKGQRTLTVSTAEPAKRLTVLLVDDDLAFLEQMQKCLQLDQHIVLTADCAMQAERVVAENDVDVALVDHFLPTTDQAVEVVKTIQQTNPDGTIWLVSAFSSTAAGIEIGKLAAVDRFFEKDARLAERLRVELRNIRRGQELVGDREAEVRRLWRSVNRCQTSRPKGKALERLLAVMLETVCGFRISRINARTATEEIDIMLRVGPEAGWPNDVSYVLVEAKNWTKSVGKNEYVQTRSKLLNRHRRVTVAFLITTGKIARTARIEATRHASDPYVVVLVDGKALRKLVLAKDRGSILRELHEQAFLT